MGEERGGKGQELRPEEVFPVGEELRSWVGLNKSYEVTKIELCQGILPENWKECGQDLNGNMQYHNSVTGETRLVRPIVEPAVHLEIIDEKAKSTTRVVTIAELAYFQVILELQCS